MFFLGHPTSNNDVDFARPQSFQKIGGKSTIFFIFFVRSLLRTDYTVVILVFLVIISCLSCGYGRWNWGNCGEGLVFFDQKHGITVEQVRRISRPDTAEKMFGSERRFRRKLGDPSNLSEIRFHFGYITTNVSIAKQTKVANREKAIPR